MRDFGTVVVFPGAFVVIAFMRSENYKGLELCAKSGTAQVGGDKKPHAWFAGYLNREDVLLVFVVIIENGGSGSRVAGPVAARCCRPQ